MSLKTIYSSLATLLLVVCGTVQGHQDCTIAAQNSPQLLSAFAQFHSHFSDALKAQGSSTSRFIDLYGIDQSAVSVVENACRRFTSQSQDLRMVLSTKLQSVKNQKDIGSLSRDFDKDQAKLVEELIQSLSQLTAKNRSNLMEYINGNFRSHVHVPSVQATKTNE